MGNYNIDNERLLLEIESLEDDAEAKTGVIENKNKGSSIFFIITLILMLALTVVFFGGYNTDEYALEEKEVEEYTDEEVKNFFNKEKDARNKFEEQKSNIEIKRNFFSANKELIAVVSNNNDEPITDLKIEVIFYDGDNKPIEIDSSIIGIVEKNTEYYAKFYETPNSFERYEILISKEYYSYAEDTLEYVTQDISYEIVDNENFKNLLVKNNSSKEISEASFQIVYYNEQDEIIDVEDISVFDIKKKRTQTEGLNLFIWDEKTYNLIPYSRYEVNLLGAYIY